MPEKINDYISIVLKTRFIIGWARWEKDGRQQINRKRFVRAREPTGSFENYSVVKVPNYYGISRAAVVGLRY